MKQIRAIRALRWNYRWRGVRIMLRNPVVIPGSPPLRGRGWWLVLRHPTRVRDWQHYVAEGGCS